MTIVRLWGGEVNLTGLYVFGVVALVMCGLKLTVFDHWTWWRVILPLAIFVGFNVTYAVVGFIYLTFAKLPEQSEEEQAALDEAHDLNPDYWISMLFFTVFADNAVRWLEGSEDAYWFWPFSGDSNVLAVFGGLSVLILFFYWSSIGQVLRQPD